MKSLKKSLCCLFLVMIIFYSAIADENSDLQKNSNSDFPAALSITISDAVDYALERNLSVKQGNLTLEQKKRQMDYVWGSLIPSIRASASLNKVFSDDNLPMNFSVGANVTLALNPSIYTQVKSAELNYEMQQMTYESTVRSVELNVRKLYYSLLYEKENLTLLQNNVDTAKTQYNSNLSKYNHGTISYLDVLSAQNSLQNANISLDVARGTYESDIANFKQVLGIPQSVSLTLSGSLDDIMNLGDIDLKSAEGSSVTIANYEKQLEIAQNSLLATRFAAWGPSVSASYSYNASGNTDTGLKSQNYGTISLSVSIPLDGFLPWSSGSQSIQNQLDAISNLEMEIENAKTSAAINIDNYQKQIKQYQDNIALRKQAITLAEQAYTMTSQAYSRGTRDLLSLQNSLSTLQQTQLSLKSDVLKLASAILELENSLGIPYGTLTGTATATEENQ